MFAHVAFSAQGFQIAKFVVWLWFSTSVSVFVVNCNLSFAAAILAGVFVSAEGGVAHSAIVALFALYAAPFSPTHF